MGNASSAFQRISSVIPPCHEPVWEDSPKWADKLRDRDQLIHAIIFIFSNNGKDSLDGYDFRLLYRKEEDAAGESFAATMIAVREGIIKSQIESRFAGDTQTKAFKAFRKHIQILLDELLKTVPNITAEGADATEAAQRPAVEMPAAESARSSRETLAETSDLPPPYKAA